MTNSQTTTSVIVPFDREENTMSDEHISEVEVDDPIGDDDEVGNSIRYMITSYGADMPVDGLVKRLDQDDIFIPDFQRNFVWTLAQASRFIESLLLGLPVPGIFLFKEPDTQKLMVVDGQQRLKTLQSFYKGVFGDKRFHLTGVSDELKQKTYEALDTEDRRRLDDSILHATIFQQGKPSDDRGSIYEVFERLNTGGTPLRSQEIRACVYRGRLNELLSELAQNQHWRQLYVGRNSRKKDEEIILRFFALYYSLDEYERPMKRFLNEFMDVRRQLDQPQEDEFRRIFERTVETAATILTCTALRPERALNVSVADAVLVGLARRLESGKISDHSALKRAHEKLLKRFKDEALHTVGTTTKDRVNRRIQYAHEAYGPVK